MTETHVRAIKSSSVNKPTLVALLLSASVLAGCARNPVPEFSYDESVPPLPTPPASAAEERPRPLHTPPVWTVAHGGAVAGTPTGRIENANAAARVEPRREGYYNAIQIYPWSEGALYQVYAAPGQITNIALEPGERLTGAGPIAAGDPATGAKHGPDVAEHRQLGVRESIAVGQERDGGGVAVLAAFVFFGFYHNQLKQVVFVLPDGHFDDHGVVVADQLVAVLLDDEFQYLPRAAAGNNDGEQAVVVRKDGIGAGGGGGDFKVFLRLAAILVGDQAAQGVVGLQESGIGCKCKEEEWH